jgi:hypothetical protein
MIIGYGDEAPERPKPVEPETKTIAIWWEVEFTEEVEVPADWEYGNDVERLLEYTDMPHCSGDGVRSQTTDWGCDE